MVRIKESDLGVEAGKIYSRWTVLGKPFSGPRGIRSRWFVVCQCECGEVVVVGTHSLNYGTSRGCRSCHIADSNRTHGGTKSPLFAVWNAMKQRCFNPNDKGFVNYGGRGISVCSEWSSNFVAFRDWSIANGYAAGLQIDRRNNDGNYEPLNCRWVTSMVNNSNKRKRSARVLV